MGFCHRELIDALRDLALAHDRIFAIGCNGFLKLPPERGAADDSRSDAGMIFIADRRDKGVDIELDTSVENLHQVTDLGDHSARREIYYGDFELVKQIARYSARDNKHMAPIKALVKIKDFGYRLPDVPPEELAEIVSSDKTIDDEPI